MPSKTKSSKDCEGQHKTLAGKALHKIRKAEAAAMDAQAANEPEGLEVGESAFRKNVGKGTIVKIAIISVLVIALLVYLAWDIIAKGPLMQLLGNRDRLVEAMHNLGPWAPFFYVQLQILQIVVAPIPGQIVGGVGGFLFGGWGILWTTIGSIIGFWLVFLIARKFGRPLLEKIFKKSVLDKFDFIINAKGSALIIFAIFLLPGFPDDAVCYIAGLTKLSMKKLLLISFLGRFPTIIVVNLVGAGLSENNLGLVIGLSVLSVIILGIFTWKREAILSLLKRGEKDSKDVDNSQSKKISAGEKSNKSTNIKTKKTKQD